MKYFERERLVFTQYHGFTPSEELRRILAAVLDLVSTKEVELGLGDSRNMKVIRPADQEYINTVWFPEFLRLSKIRKSASIESTDVFNRMATKNILQTIGDRIPFEFQYFDSLKEACHWLGVDPAILSQ
ncbi:hypothetical protein [Rufibacter radiotolerans]|nr:hypothetical protein [Rufibacter radiotolerans]